MRNLIPPFIHEHYKNGNVSGEFKAAAMFVDISGFTQMTDELMQHGREGIEVLSDILKYLFEPMVQIIYAHDGFITIYAGDAFTAIFKAREDYPTTVRKAVKAAQEIQKFFLECMDYESKFGNFRFGVKVGLGFGNVDWGIVGSETSKVYYFRGPAVDHCANAEHYAEKGEIWGHRTFVKLVENLLAHPLAEESNYLKIEHLKEFFIETIETPQTDITENIVKELAGEKEFYFPEGEFREAVAVFFSFEEIPNLDEFMQTVFELQERYGGSHPRLDFGDKGSNILLFFGTPVAYENKEIRALQFIADLRKAILPPAQLKAGITTGMMYTGFYGAELQQAFSCLGNTVNQAARFMVKAQMGQVLTDEHLAQILQFEFQLLGNFTYKGRSEPIPTYEFKDETLRKQMSVYTATFHQPLGLKHGGIFIGREAELQQLEEILERIVSGNFGGVVYVEGEAGSGKSRLIQEVKRRIFTDEQGIGKSSENQAYKWFFMPCDGILRQSLNPVIYFLNEYFFQNPTDSIEARKNNFEIRFNNLFQKTRLPELKRELKRIHSILAGMLNLHWDGSLFSQLDAKARHENSISAVKTLIKAESLQKPIIIELEDGHWIDDDTLNFLRVLTRNVENYPFIILSACRYRDDGTSVDFELTNVPTERIKLEQMLKDAARYLVAQNLSKGGRLRPVPNETLDFIFNRSDGNPFFIEQISLYLKENEFIDEKWNLVFDPGDDASTFRVPSSINDVLVARIDRLAQELKEIMKTASVLGQEFAVEILSSMLLKTNQINQENINNYLLVGEKETIWEALSEIRYIFKHALIREAVYEMQLKRQIRLLHQLAAESIEERYQSELEPHYFELAEHFEKAQISDKAIHYLKKAGIIAQEAYQNQDAIRIFDRLLEFPLPTDEELNYLYQKASTLETSGHWELAIETYRVILEEADQLDKKEWIVKSANPLTWLLAVRGNHDDAFTLAKRSLQISTEINDSQGKIGAFKNLGTLHGYAGRKDEFIQAYSEMLSIAEEMADAKAIVSANFQLRYSKLEDGNLIETFEKYLKIAEENGDLREVSRILFFMGDIYLITQNFPDAEKCNQRMFELVQKTGDKQGMCYAIGDRGIVCSKMGRLEDAIECYKEKLVIARELGDGYNIWEGLINMERDYKYLKDYRQAEATVNLAIDTAREHQLKRELCVALLAKVDLYLELSRMNEARPILEEATNYADQLEEEGLIFRSNLYNAQLDYAAGDMDAEKRQLEKITEETPETNRAAIFYTLWKMTAKTEYRKDAVKSYQQLYDETQSYDYKACLKEMNVSI